jgi:hypothetical protein
MPLFHAPKGKPVTQIKVGAFLKQEGPAGEYNIGKTIPSRWVASSRWVA